MELDSNKSRQAFRLKGTTPALSLLCLQTADLDAVERQLVDHIAQMPQFFLNAPVMLDLESLGGASVDFARVAEVLRRHRLVPVAVRNPTDAQREQAVDAGWGILQATLVRPRHAATVTTGATPAEVHAASLTVQQAVRSGQVVYAAGGDLVVLAPVSSGAELIADGHIHVYAALRGRALAGASDNPNASIFCMSLEAELVSIAGHHLMSEQIPDAHRGKPARVRLHDGQIVVSGL
jgi:septum site-determining protein MinC